MTRMSLPPADERPLRRPLPLRQRLAVDAAAVVLTLTAALFAALPAAPAVVPSASPIPSGTPGSSPSASPVAVEPSSTPIPSELRQFPVNADAYVYAGRSTQNYGTTTQLRVDSDPETLTYLRFTVSGITTPVLGARLRIHALGRQTLGFQVRSVKGAWSESRLTYGARPADGAVVGSSGLIAGEAWIEVQLTAAVDGNGQVSFVLFTTGTTALTFDSREAGAATAPMLVVEVAKSPGS
jgi:hypothetical protein